MKLHTDSLYTYFNVRRVDVDTGQSLISIIKWKFHSPRTTELNWSFRASCDLKSFTELPEQKRQEFIDFIEAYHV
jgi:hypothetical protein